MTLLARDEERNWTGRSGLRRAGVNKLIDDQTRRRRAIAPFAWRRAAVCGQAHIRHPHLALALNSDLFLSL
jgi:hypothetical protein